MHGIALLCCYSISASVKQVVRKYHLKAWIFIRCFEKKKNKTETNHLKWWLMVIYHATKYKICSKHIALNLTSKKDGEFPLLKPEMRNKKPATLVTSLVTSLFSTATSTQNTKSLNKNLASAHHPPGSCDLLIDSFSSETWPIFLSSFQLITKQHQSVKQNCRKKYHTLRIMGSQVPGALEIPKPCLIQSQTCL